VSAYPAKAGEREQPALKPATNSVPKLRRPGGQWAAWASYNVSCILENRMKIAKNTVVSVAYKLSDAQGNLIEESDEPMVYLHGGYDGTFPKIEEELDGHEAGFETQIQLEPQDAFGEYDPDLVKIEPRNRFPEPLEVGMQFEGTPEEGDEDLDSLVYVVTDVAEDKVVLDGNHPLAGMALRFALTVKDVRPATEDEIQHEHAHGADGLEVLDEDEDDEEEGKSGPTLH
jgi:FKBP-type peptidyl-prolyl cis-trans isomerase SlyD